MQVESVYMFSLFWSSKEFPVPHMQLKYVFQPPNSLPSREGRGHSHENKRGNNNYHKSHHVSIFKSRYTADCRILAIHTGVDKILPIFKSAFVPHLRHTHTKTHAPSTVILAAHACRGLIIHEGHILYASLSQCVLGNCIHLVFNDIIVIIVIISSSFKFG